MGIQTYDRLSGVNIKEKATSDTDTLTNDTNATKIEAVSYRYLSIYYGTTDVKASTTSLKIDLNTFISNVGGNLGLFVGFSVLGGLFFIYDFTVFVPPIGRGSKFSIQILTPHTLSFDLYSQVM